MVDFTLTETEKEIMELSNLQHFAKQATARYWDYPENEKLMPEDPLNEPVPVLETVDPQIEERLKTLREKREKEKNGGRLFATYMRMCRSVGGGLPIIHRSSG